jgi:alkanesulfonate monooxygenase SsuD/methylene tetrahydromethanopterin reductase-like flavin-dependent oxidoreductase (luciferase family)
MAAIAGATSRVRIGTAVLLPGLRHPITLAHSLATADVISGGRIVIGAGVGGAFTPEQKNEWTAVGVSPEGRAGRLAEMVQIMKRLWQEDNVTFEGKHFQLADVTLDPKPLQPGGVPILLASHYATGSDVQYKRAGRYADGVMGITDIPENYAAVLRKVQGFAEEAGRDPSALERAFYMTVNLNEPQVAETEANDFLIEYYGVNHWGDRWGPWGSPENVVERMAAYANAGARHLVVRFASWDQRGQLRRFVDEVMPAFRAMDPATSS